MKTPEALDYFKRRKEMCIDDRIQEAENVAIRAIEKQLELDRMIENFWDGMDPKTDLLSTQLTYDILRILSIEHDKEVAR